MDSKKQEKILKSTLTTQKNGAVKLMGVETDFMKNIKKPKFRVNHHLKPLTINIK